MPTENTPTVRELATSALFNASTALWDASTELEQQIHLLGILVEEFENEKNNPPRVEIATGATWVLYRDLCRTLADINEEADKAATARQALKQAGTETQPPVERERERE